MGKVGIIILVLKPAIGISGEELDGAVRPSLKPDDIPFCERIENGHEYNEYYRA